MGSGIVWKSGFLSTSSSEDSSPARENILASLAADLFWKVSESELGGDGGAGRLGLPRTFMLPLGGLTPLTRAPSSGFVGRTEIPGGSFFKISGAALRVFFAGTLGAMIASISDMSCLISGAFLAAL